MEREKSEQRERKRLTDQDRGMKREKLERWNEKGDENILRLRAEEKCQMTWLDKEA